MQVTNTKPYTIFRHEKGFCPGQVMSLGMEHNFKINKHM